MSHSQQVGARICKFELSGESNIYVCPRDEYCCNIGCCISPTFQFYQLWYYWFMVFFMFLVCSGGQWWYRYVMQGRCASAIAPPVRRDSYPRQARVAYTPARDTVVLHHLWKPSYSGPGVNGPPPSYSQSGSCSSSMDGPKPSPYLQLYGPPPSYESVIGAGPVPIHAVPQSSGMPPHQGGRIIGTHHLQPLDLQQVAASLQTHAVHDTSSELQQQTEAHQNASRHAEQMFTNAQHHTSVSLGQDEQSSSSAIRLQSSPPINHPQVP